MGTAALATAAGDAPTTIDGPCRDIRHGLVRIVFDENACKKNEAHLSWDVQGAPALGRRRSGPRRACGAEGRPGARRTGRA